MILNGKDIDVTPTARAAPFHTAKIGARIVQALRMSKKATAVDIYAARGSSMPQRIALTMTVGACVAVAWWLLAGSGLGSVGAWFGRDWNAGDRVRRLLLAVALSVYFVRLLFTQFVFLKRAVSWKEASMIGPWVLVIYLSFAIAGGTNGAPFGASGAIGILFFAVGSWVNSYAEYARHVWKQHPENHGRLYTSGLFRYSRHPNYLGDLISFSGLCLIADRWATIAVPLTMLAGFVFANIPALDEHLHDHYGPAFDEYASRTRKLIPFVY
jgi:protein-S-isoprenylcysteine O-methyltransferase Ste14